MDKGELAVRFLGNLTLVGDFAGQPFEPRPWQADPVRKIFGTLLPDGRRQYREVFLALPRKQAKTTLLSGLGIFALAGEAQGKQGQQIYSASGDREQASIIFRTMAAMIRADESLDSLCTIHDSYKRITFDPLGNTFQALSSESKTKHGLGPSHVLIDELHVFPSRDLVDVLTTGFGARREPLTVYISTAGHDLASICWQLWDHARKVRDNVVQDPTFLPILYEAGPDEPWDDEAVWHRVMPALGDFCSLEFIRDECRKAKLLPSFENTFRQLYLNQWTEQASRWIQTQRWTDLPKVDAITLAGKPCFGGLDLGVTGDMSAFAAASPNERGGLDFEVKFWAPGNGRWKQESRNRELYPAWEKQGYLTFTGGEATDFDQIEAEILAYNQRRPIASLFADRAYASHILSRLLNIHGLSVTGIPQGPITLNEPMTRLESMILDGKCRYVHNPVLDWNIANANVIRTSTGLMHLDKSGAANRIDGLAAIIDAVAAHGASPQQITGAYNERDPFF